MQHIEAVRVHGLGSQEEENKEGNRKTEEESRDEEEGQGPGQTQGQGQGQEQGQEQQVEKQAQNQEQEPKEEPKQGQPEGHEQKQGGRVLGDAAGALVYTQTYRGPGGEGRSTVLQYSPPHLPPPFFIFVIFPEAVT